MSSSSFELNLKATFISKCFVPNFGEIGSVILHRKTKKKCENLRTEHFQLAKLTLPFGSGEPNSEH